MIDRMLKLRKIKNKARKNLFNELKVEIENQSGTTPVTLVALEDDPEYSKEDVNGKR
jgi:hypothetical protein